MNNQKITNTTILLSNLFLEVPLHSEKSVAVDTDNRVLVGTLVSNLLSYGYIPSSDAMKALKNSTLENLTFLWNNLEPSLKEVTGANRNMEKFVVYKNFPKEVLEKSQAEYWIAQIYMYFGAPNDWFTQEPVARDALFEKVQLKVLQVAKGNALQTIYERLVKSPARWTNDQETFAKHLIVELKVSEISADSFSFKENALNLINSVIHNADLKTSVRCLMSNATDVLRLCAAMSEQDISLRGKITFKKFVRSERRLILGMLNNCKNLVDDMSSRPETFKHLLSVLHPNDYKFENVNVAYDKLYRGDYETFNGKVEGMMQNKSLNISTMKMLASRPGEFVRRFHKLATLFGQDAVAPLKVIIPSLKTSQLLKLDSYVKSIGNRKTLIFAPNGNWTKAQFVKNEKAPLHESVQRSVHQTITQEMATRLNAQFPHGVILDDRTADIKLQTNDQELAPYGRGTSFDIPANVKFIRSASYWESGDTYNNTWYDNGFNFFDASWKPLGTVCWNSTATLGGAAAFSGDPTNSKDIKGRACQMIDLYLDKLANQGVRYVLWNILCYSKKSFSDATEVLATLQFGEHAEKGKLYEPSRAQMVFPLKGKNLTKYVAYMDLETRKLVYMDANLYGNVQSAQSNEALMSEKMPAFVEYLDSLPSVKDLFKHITVDVDSEAVPVLYDDSKADIQKNGLAYVFKPVNESNVYEALDLSEILNVDNKGKLESKKTAKAKIGK